MKKPPYQNHLALYTWAAKYAYNKDVIDIGCGEGYGLQVLSVFARHVMGVDNADRAVRLAESKQYHCQSHILRCNLDDEAERGAFLTEFCNVREKEERPLVVGFEILEHLEDPHRFIEVLERRHIPFLFSVPHNDHHPLHKTFYHSDAEALRLFNPEHPVTLLHYRDGVVYQPSGARMPQRYVIASPALVQ